MKMTDVDARLGELESRRITPGLSVTEQNELRDCEITLGMVEAPPHARDEAARRVEQFGVERAAKETPTQPQPQECPYNKLQIDDFSSERERWRAVWALELRMQARRAGRYPGPR